MGRPADNAPRTESTTRKPASYRPSSKAAYRMAPASSAADVHSTARRFGAYDRTTNLLNESANFATPLLTDAHRSLYEAATLKTALKLSSILSTHALAKSPTRGHGGFLV